MELLASSSRQKPLRPDALTRHNRDVVASRRSHDAERVSHGEEGERKKRRGGEEEKRRRRREEEKEEKNEKRRSAKYQHTGSNRGPSEFVFFLHT